MFNFKWNSKAKLCNNKRATLNRTGCGACGAILCLRKHWELDGKKGSLTKWQTSTNSQQCCNFENRANVKAHCQHHIVGMSGMATDLAFKCYIRTTPSIFLAITTVACVCTKSCIALCIGELCWNNFVELCWMLKHQNFVESAPVGTPQQSTPLPEYTIVKVVRAVCLHPNRILLVMFPVHCKCSCTFNVFSLTPWRGSYPIVTRRLDSF